MSKLNKLMKNIIAREEFSIAIVLIISFLLRIINVYNFPYIFADEHALTARAWCVLKYKTLDIFPFGYDYDHPFLGWIIMGILLPISPGVLVYEKARFIMAIFGTIHVLFVYLIGLKFFKKKNCAIVSAICLGCTFELINISRMILLDNIATLFLLIAVYTFTTNRKFFVSSIFFGLATWVKYTYIIFFPGFVVLFIKSYYEKHNDEPIFNIKNKIFLKDLVWFFFKWLLIFGIIFCLWPLYALIQGDFFPDGEGYSLYNRLIGQLTLRGSSPFWDSNGFFVQSTQYFLRENPLIFIVPLIIVILSLIIRKFRIKHPNSLKLLVPVLFFLIPYFIFLMRGGVTYFFYYIPVFPFFSLIIGSIPVIIEEIVKIINKRKRMNSENSKISILTEKVLKISFFIILIVFTLFPFNFNTLIVDKNDSIKEMYSWVTDNLPEDAVYITNVQMYPEFKESEHNQVYPYWRSLSIDPIFNSTVLFGNWKNIDYFITDSYGPANLQGETFEMDGVLLEAFTNSHLLISFGEFPDSILIFKVDK